MQVAGVISIVLLGVLGVFQLALALGAPWGRAAWGGQNEGVLPGRLRVSSGVAGIAIYPLMVLYVLTSSELIEGDWLPGTGPVAMWILVAFFGIGTLANFASRSRIERIWGPVSLTIAICCVVIAVGI